MLDKAISSFFSSYDLQKPYVLAFSGGSDSLSLLIALSKLNFSSLSVVYVNHKLRSNDELEKEIALNKKNVELLGHKLIVETLLEGEVVQYAREHSVSIEAAARVLRYRVLDKYNALVITAHNWEDQVESMLMRILYSSPLLSYSGIWEKQNTRLRPLLKVKKTQILDYLKETSFQYSTDSTNDVLFCRRNKIRKAIKISEEAEALLHSIACNMQKVRTKYSTVEIKDKNLYRVMSRSEFLSAHPIGQEIALNNFLNSSTIVSKKEKDRIKEHIEQSRSYNAKTYYIRIRKDEVLYFDKRAYFVKPLTLNTPIFDDYYFTATDDKTALSIDYRDAIVRFNEVGDTIWLENGEKSISELLKKWKVPYALVVENRQEIIAVYASMFSAFDRVSSNVKQSSWHLGQRYTFSKQIKY